MKYMVEGWQDIWVKIKASRTFLLARVLSKCERVVLELPSLCSQKKAKLETKSTTTKGGERIPTPNGHCRHCGSPT